MFNSDAIAYIPLFITAGLCAVFFIFLAIIKIRKTAKVSLLSFLSITIIIADCIYTALNPSIMRFVVVLLLASLIILPYLIMLSFGKPRKETHKKVVEEQKEEKKEIIIEDVRPEEINIVEKGRSFAQLASDAFGKKEGFQNLLDTINRSCIEVTGADGGAILMVDDFEDSINVKSFVGNFPPPYKLPDEIPHKELRVSTSFKFAAFPLRDNIFGEVASSGKAEMINEPKTDSRIFENRPEEFLKLGSYIFIPIHLRGKGIVIGLLALSKNLGKTFTQQEFDRALLLASFAEVALKTTTDFAEFYEKNEISKESKIVEDLQNILLPKKIGQLEGISFGSFTEHTEGVCSDVYDVLQARKGRISFILMDVAGKGKNSFLVMSMIRSMVRLLVNTPQSSGTILTLANKEICGETNFEHFSSIALINYNPASKTVQFSSAGTTGVYLYSKEKGSVERKSASNEPLGVEKTTTYKDIQFTVSQGDIIITFTDGLIEALDSSGKQYSMSRLSNLIKTNNALSGTLLADLIKTDMKKFVGSQMLYDDQTLLIIKIQ
ncbi:SpoIIE family protein phosphatase [Treponema pectinovorum]|uniref:GAF domain-containing SpoIIE family protein phosphatase n=1 Tax=Treponema pectinovorum TaxID=164 RepID=UPI003D924A25